MRSVFQVRFYERKDPSGLPYNDSLFETKEAAIDFAIEQFLRVLDDTMESPSAHVRAEVNGPLGLFVKEFFRQEYEREAKLAMALHFSEAWNGDRIEITERKVAT